MSTLAELQQVIMSLPKSEYAQLVRWLQEYDSEEWDREIEEDVLAGKLDFLKAKALEAKTKGELGWLTQK